MGKSYSTCYSISESNFSRSDKIGYVWVGLKRLAWVFGSPNHWSVIMEVGNGYLTVQFDTDGSIGKTFCETFRNACLATWGYPSCDIRLSKYGYSNDKTLGDLQDYLCGSHTYVLGFSDCQNFARKVVDFLTGKWVGAWPIEDGPTISP